MMIPVNDMCINIDLEPDIYTTIGNSTEGKTFLLKCLNTARRLGNESVYTYTYSERYSVLDDLINLPAAVKLIVLDRADLYFIEDLVSVLSCLCEHCIILVDNKIWGGGGVLYVLRISL